MQRLRRLSTITANDERHLSATSNTMLIALLQVMNIVSVVPPFDSAWATINDANDLPIWTAAIRSGAGFIISHNTRDFPPRNAEGLCEYAGIEFVTVESFVGDVLGIELELIGAGPIPVTGRIAHRRRE
jgi:hypothetical protein